MSYLGQKWDAFQTNLRQTVETRKRKSSLRYNPGAVEAISPGEDIAEQWEQSIQTAIVRLSLINFAYDVAEPGLRINGNNNAVNYLEDEWIPQAGVIAGERHKPLDPLVAMAPIQRWGRGGLILEHVRNDPSDIESPITGVNPIRPETGKFITLEGKEIIVEPGDVESGVVSEDDVAMTRRGEPAAFIQWHEDAIRAAQSRDAIPLSINDFTRTVFSPGIGGGPMAGVWGRPVTSTIADDVAGFKNVRKALERAIMTKGWGLWDISFGREVLEYKEDGDEIYEIVEWTDDKQDEYVDDVQAWDPGGVLTHDATTELNRLEPTVPDLIDELEFYVSNITAALPTPKFVIGFEENINQFVTEGQDARYQLLVNYERTDVSNFFEQLFKTVIDHNTSYSSEELEVRIEPPEEESPILSLTKEEIERISIWMKALADASGTNDPTMLVDEELIRTLILQLPENSGADIDEDLVDTDNEEVQSQIEEIKQQLDEEDPSNLEEDPDPMPADD